jgi:hypothetical protein
MPMSRPTVQNIVTTGQLVQICVFLIGVAMGGAYWAFGKDKNDVDLGAKIDGQIKTAGEQNAALGAQIAKMDGKLEAYGAAQGALSSRVDLLDQRQQTADETAKEGRQERQSFQRETEGRLGQLEQRVGVIEALRPR